MEKKLTQKELFGMVLAVEGIAQDAMLREFIEAQVAKLDAKAEKAKTYKRKEKEDTLKSEVYSRLDRAEFRTIRDIIADIDDSEVTSAKVTSRLTSLVKDGLAEKQEIVVETEKEDGSIKKSKLMGYKAV